MNQSPLLADPQALALESLTSKDTQVILVVKTIKSVALCPKCRQPSSRIHSRYQRTVADLPCFGVSVQIQLLTRRFFCINQTCVRRIFCERLPRVVAAYGRQTIRLNDALHLIGMMLGGQAGGIENSLHWVKDVIFGEDSAPFKDYNAATNWSLIRTIAINLARLAGYNSLTKAEHFLAHDINKLFSLLE